MNTPVFADFETRSRCSLKKHGGRVYWEHPSTEVLCCVFHFPGIGRVDWVPAWHGPFDPGPIDVLAAQNAHGFERFGWARMGWAPPGRWIDTAQVARTMGLRGGLDALAALVGRNVKDKEGNRLTVGLSTCRRPTKKTAHLSPEGVEIPAAVWATFSDEEKRAYGVQADPAPVLARGVEYCAADVDALVSAWPILEPFARLEEDVKDADTQINDRGIGVDLELVRALLAIDARQAQEACAAVGLTPSQLRSPAQFRTLTGLPDATFATVDEAMHTHADQRVRDICRARLALASIARGKLEAALARTQADGRMRDLALYGGAHTMRWAGKGFQVHNIPWIDKAEQTAKAREQAAR